MLESKQRENADFWAFTLAFAIDSRCDLENEAWQELAEVCRDQPTRVEIVRQLRELGHGDRLSDSLDDRSVIKLEPKQEKSPSRSRFLPRLKGAQRV